MKLGTVAALAALGMLGTGASTYLATPPGGLGSANSSAGNAAPQTAEAPTSGAPGDTAPKANVASSSSSSAGSATSLAELTTGSTVLLDARLAHASLLRGSTQDSYVMLDLSTGASATQVKAPRVSLALVIDKSGSMRGSRFENALAAAVSAVDRLRDGDSVSVIAFDTKPETVVAPVVLTSSTRASAVEAIKKIRLGGDTCISCGLDQALAELASARGAAQPDVQRVLLLSDGEPTAGVRDPAGFATITRHAVDVGATISTIGVDVDFNERVMSAIALGGNGHHYFVEREADLARVFEAEAETISATVASDASAEIELAPGVEVLEVFDRSFDRSGSRITVPLGSFSVGARKTVLVKVRVPVSSNDAPMELASVRLRYRDVARGEAVNESGSLSVRPVADASQVAPMDGVVLDRVQRSETAAALEDANSLFRAGKTDAAQKRIDDARNQLQSRHGEAAKNAPAKKTRDIDTSFDGQAADLDKAQTRFKPAPTTTPKPDVERKKKAAVRENEAMANPYRE
ncbi:MAG: VWA domain-containing protein [Polyangiaceae bacterium]